MEQGMKMKIAKLLGLIGLAASLAGATAEAKEWKTVRIGMDATYAPFESVDTGGKIVGWEVDYANALCAKMKVTCTFQNQDWDGVIPALLSGKFDVIFSSMNETPARAKKVLFSDVYYATAPVWVAQAGNKSDDVSLAAMKGKLVGTQSSTVFANYLDKNYKGIEVKLYPGGDEPLLDLASGRLDYAVSDQLVTQQFIDKNPGCCRIVAEIPRESNKEIFGPGVGAAFRPDDTDLAAMFNKAIAEAAADGTFKTLETKYFKIDIAPKK
jgi:polar amino acid transport system substrate-binding protein